MPGCRGARDGSNSADQPWHGHASEDELTRGVGQDEGDLWCSGEEVIPIRTVVQK